jgi:hypothetical protein
MGSRPPDSDAEDRNDAALVDALLVYVEPLAEDAHVVVIGDAESPVADRLFELGVRSVQVFDPDPARAANAAQTAPPGVSIRALVDDLDVRDGAFDLAIVPDMAELNDPNRMVGRLRRAVAPSGAVVAMGRTQAGDDEDGALEVPFATDLGLATLDYAAFYELFAVEFDDVTIAGVVPFTGVVFAQLGGEEEDAPSVTVDTRLGSQPAPRVFVVVASQRTERASPEPLDPYTIVQVSEPVIAAPLADPALLADLTAMQLKTELLAAQLEEARERLTVSELRGSEVVARLERAALERDVALTRGMELEVVLAASQQTLVAVEQRLGEAERRAAERHDVLPIDPERLGRVLQETPPLGAPTIDVQTIVGRAEQAEAALAIALAELARRDALQREQVDVGLLRERAEQAESALARYADEMTRTTDAAVHEIATYEERLRERAHVIAALEKEILRREAMIHELLDQQHDSFNALNGAAGGGAFEAAPLSIPAIPPVSGDTAELRRKLDELALDIARREGELVARGWRITELENENERLSKSTAPSQGRAPDEELGRLRDELDALRQALAQEHTARVAAESGEELARVRSELAQQSALLEQTRRASEASKE